MANKIMAKWGKKKWLVSKKKVNAIENIGYTMSYDTDEKKKEKRGLTVPYTVYKAMGVDPKKEINQWYKYLGQSKPFYLGKKRFGPKKVKLTGVDVSEIMVTTKGVAQSATFTLTFEEP